MIRLLGAITGSALALAALLIFVGVPQFKAMPNDIAPAVVTLPLRVAPVEALPDAVAIAAVTAEASAATETLAEAPLVESPLPEELTSEEPLAAQPIDEPPPLQPDTLQWYAFWSPFRSEIAASGFVSQLQRVTGLDYRVIKLKPGVYEVAFAYADDGEIPMNLSQISAATGLDMPGN